MRRNSQISLKLASLVVRSELRSEAPSAFASYELIRCNSAMDCAMNDRWARPNDTHKSKLYPKQFELAEFLWYRRTATTIHPKPDS